jgi:Tfp pilus assembly protein PilN
MNRILAIPAYGVAIGIIILLAMTVQNAAAEIISKQNQLDTANYLLEKKQNDKKALAQVIADTQQQITTTEQAYAVYTNALKSMNKTGDLMNKDIKVTVDDIVAGLYLENISESRNQININGKADSEQQVLQYVRNLDATGRFSEITISVIKTSGTGDETYVEYSLTCALKGDRN